MDQRRVWAGPVPLFVVKCDRSQRLVAHSRLHSELKEVIGIASLNATRQILSRSFLQEAQDWHRRVCLFSEADNERCLLTCSSGIVRSYT